MEKILTGTNTLLASITWAKTGMVAVLVALGIVAYGAYIYIPTKVQTPQLLASEAARPAQIAITAESRESVAAIMKDYPEIASLIVYKMDFSHNVRTPILRTYNDASVEAVMQKHLNGDDGSLPIFLRDDTKNNNQMINVIQGGLTCVPFEENGISRAIPSLVSKLKYSCQVTIPPAFSLIRGYMVVHLTTIPEGFALQLLKLDLAELAKKLYQIDTAKKVKNLEP